MVMIPGEECRMAGSVYAIPDDVLKSAREHIPAKDLGLVSLSGLCRELSISVSTGRNWVKLGKLVPERIIGGTAYFRQESVRAFKEDLKSGKTEALRSRRNKKYISGSELYRSYVSEESPNIQTIRSVIQEVEKTGVDVTENLIRCVTAECAIQFILGKKGCPEKKDALLRYLGDELPEYDEWFLIDDLIPDKNAAMDLRKRCPAVFNHTFVYEASEDILGLIYMSLLGAGERKAAGSYYTPVRIVRRLLRELFERNRVQGKTIFDPCCGTGSFILQLPDEIGYEYVYGNDIDSLSAVIARINFALKYDVSDPVLICSHITEKDFLASDSFREYDFIIGNPPWGYDYTDSEKEELRSRYEAARGNSIESCDVFVEKALSGIKAGGVLSFVLPEAILIVKSHRPVREIMLRCCDFQYLEYLGNVFDRVQCPGIILQMRYGRKHDDSRDVLTVCSGNREYKVSAAGRASAEYISFTMTDEEYRILQKADDMSDKTVLKGNAEFALGIVTGNNKEYLSREKKPGLEMVLRGADLLRYRFIPSAEYISFEPETFQQTAPARYYRAPEKLLYRFICSQLVFAYDNCQTLSLNSCNILIPKIPGMSMKYVMAVLNSRIAQFYFSRKYHSIKVLRSHIEQIPIPIAAPEEQSGIVSYVDSVLSAQNCSTIKNLYETIDKKISRLYNMSDEEYSVIKDSMAGENLFLEPAGRSKQKKEGNRKI